MTSPENLPSQILDEILACIGWLERMTTDELHELANLAAGGLPPESVHGSALLSARRNLLGELAHSARCMATANDRRLGQLLRSEHEDTAQD